MKHSVKVGFSFGVTSGVITTLGLMVGLSAGTHLKPAVIGGVVTIAIADSLSDALGIHVSEEAENKHTTKEVWESTLSTFFCKFAIASSFIIPILFLELDLAILANIVWGLSVLCVFSYSIAKEQGARTWSVVAEHFIIAVIVIIAAHYAGLAIEAFFS
ncbi:MAG: hypothetical protein JW771_01770 [Candidatus Thermoplasmatota archaeon]|nr:hypothetical protein [Candidatus Thermoplasmatota archaeon]